MTECKQPGLQLLMNLANGQFECDKGIKECVLKFDPEKDRSMVLSNINEVSVEDFYFLDNKPAKCVYYFEYTHQVDRWKLKMKERWHHSVNRNYGLLKINNGSYEFGSAPCFYNKCPGDDAVTTKKGGTVAQVISVAASLVGGGCGGKIGTTHIGPETQLIQVGQDGISEPLDLVSPDAEPDVVTQDTSTDYFVPDADVEVVSTDVKEVEDADIFDALDVPEDIKFDTQDLDGTDLDYLDGDAADVEEVDVTPPPEICNGLDVLNLN